MAVLSRSISTIKVTTIISSTSTVKVTSFSSKDAAGWGWRSSHMRAAPVVLAFSKGGAMAGYASSPSSVKETAAASANNDDNSGLAAGMLHGRMGDLLDFPVVRAGFDGGGCSNIISIFTGLRSCGSFCIDSYNPLLGPGECCFCATGPTDATWSPCRWPCCPCLPNIGDTCLPCL